METMLQARPDIDAGRFVLHKSLGIGNFSNVFKAWDRVTSNDVAVKALLRVPSFAGAKNSEYLITSNLSHENIIKCIGRFHLNDVQHLVVEYADQGDLFDVLRGSDFQMPHQERKRYLVQTASALEYVHGKKIVHFDVKLENLYIQRGVVKLGDFGLAGRLGSIRKGHVDGTRQYMAPELLHTSLGSHANRLDFSADCWGFGILIFVMTFSDIPWEEATKNNRDYFEFMLLGENVHRVAPFTTLSPEYRNVMVSLLSHNPASRISMKQACEILDASQYLVNEDDSDIESEYEDELDASGDESNEPVSAAITEKLLRYYSGNVTDEGVSSSGDSAGKDVQLLRTIDGSDECNNLLMASNKNPCKRSLTN